MFISALSIYSLIYVFVIAQHSIVFVNVRLFIPEFLINFPRRWICLKRDIQYNKPNVSLIEKRCWSWLQWLLGEIDEFSFIWQSYRINCETWEISGRNVTSRFDLKQLLLRRIPILAWLPQYSLSKLLHDVLAGLTVGLTVIPQGIAYAIVAGLPAQVCTFVR